MKYLFLAQKILTGILFQFQIKPPVKFLDTLDVYVSKTLQIKPPVKFLDTLDAYHEVRNNCSHISLKNSKVRE